MIKRSEVMKKGYGIGWRKDRSMSDESGVPFQCRWSTGVSWAREECGEKAEVGSTGEQVKD